jgi:DNA-binding NtrC family response regulator
MAAPESRRDVMARRAELSVCVVDDDPALVKITARRLQQSGFNTVGTVDAKEALNGVRASKYHAVVLDIKMPGMSGHEFLETALAIDPAIQIVLVTGYYSIESAIGAIRKGASDYLCKPLEFDRLVNTLDEFARQTADRIHAKRLDEQLLLNAELHGVVGKSPAMLEVFDQLRKISRHFTTVLMSGPTGAGKEMVARALHALSPASKGAFHVCTCSALEEFGLEGGILQWKQATLDHQANALNPAESCTLYLDEVTEIPMRVQASLLAALQSIEQGRISANDAASGLRIVASSSHDLRGEVTANRFREELYFRLAPLEVRIPSLTQRSQDIPLLVQHFLKTYNAVYGTSYRGFTRRAQIALLQYGWVGNVRELEHTVCGAMMVGSGQFIDVRDLPRHVQNRGSKKSTPTDWKPMSLAELRREHVRQVLAVADNLTHAAAILGIGRTSLYRMLKERAETQELQETT